MELKEINSDLCGFIRERFGVPENDPDFSDQIDLFSYGYIDSFGAVELGNFLESRFSIRLTDSDWVAFPLNTIKDISSFVLKRKKGEI